jgi:hypothetical protein
VKNYSDDRIEHDEDDEKDVTENDDDEAAETDLNNNDDRDGEEEQKDDEADGNINFCKKRHLTTHWPKMPLPDTGFKGKRSLKKPVAMQTFMYKWNP